MYIIFQLISLYYPAWVLSIYPFIKHYTIVVSIITIQFSHIYHRALTKEQRQSCEYKIPMYDIKATYQIYIYFNSSAFIIEL